MPTARTAKPTSLSAAAPTATVDLPTHRTKIATLRAMLESPEGASLDAMRSATGWQPHSLRASISTLRKSGLVIERLASADGVGGPAYRSIKPEGGAQ